MKNRARKKDWVRNRKFIKRLIEMKKWPFEVTFFYASEWILSIAQIPDSRMELSQKFRLIKHRYNEENNQTFVEIIVRYSGFFIDV